MMRLKSIVRRAVISMLCIGICWLGAGSHAWTRTSRRSVPVMYLYTHIGSRVSPFSHAQKSWKGVIFENAVLLKSEYSAWIASGSSKDGSIIQNSTRNIASAAWQDIHIIACLFDAVFKIVYYTITQLAFTSVKREVIIRKQFAALIETCMSAGTIAK